MEDCVCCDQSLMSALKAMIDAAMLDFTEMFAPAPWTDESIRPTKEEEKFAALLFRLKSLHEFDLTFIAASTPTRLNDPNNRKELQEVATSAISLGA